MTITGSEGPAACTCFSLEGEAYDGFVARYFQECVFSWQERASFYIGMASLLCWVLCQAPQFVNNIRRGSAEGLSAWLLVQWFCGDTTNLLGSFLTRQLAFQKFSAVLFVCMDTCMLSQKVYYSRLGSSKAPAPVRVGRGTSAQTLLFVAVGVAILSIEGVAAAKKKHWDPLDIEVTMIESCEPSPIVLESIMFLGNLLGWISSVFYSGSRVAQIYTNHKRKSTEGVAWTMFMFAILGNLTYTIGIVLRRDHIMKAMPWLSGSLVCLAMDTYIMIQTYMYSQPKPLIDDRSDSLSQALLVNT